MIFLGHSTLAEICGGHVNHCFSKLLYYQPKSKRFRFSLKKTIDHIDVGDGCCGPFASRFFR